MSSAVSPSTNRRYGVWVVTQEWGVPRSTFYAAKLRKEHPRSLKKRGPRTVWPDDLLTDAIRRVLEGSPFTGEGHRKVWARLRSKGIRTSKARVLRLMRENRLLAPSRGPRSRGPRNHDGTIRTSAPDRMWGTDATGTFTRKDGAVTVFIAVDHCTSEAIGIHAARSGNRFEALEPIRQGIRKHYGAFHEKIAQGLSLRHDHGSPYMSHDFQKELRFLGVESSPSFVRAPEGNGVSERFIRTLKEQLLWVTTFDTVEDLGRALHHWIDLYNENWMVERHGFRSPSQVRRDFQSREIVA